MRLRFGTIASLALCAAAAAAAAAHVAIDVVGDYAVAHDTYDNVPHDSRALVTGIALLIAFVLAGRGLRVCCEIAAANRTRLPRPAFGWRERLGLVLGAVTASSVLVPAMEWLDGRLDGVAVTELDGAFGGSIVLGLITTVICATVVALAVYALARWLISHRDTIATIIGTLMRRLAGSVRPCRHDLVRCLAAPRRRRTPHALRLCKRGPPVQTLVLSPL